MRLIYSGLFDEHPGLKIFLGHLGEGLPYWFPRLDFYWHKNWVGKGPGLKRKPSDYLKTNSMTTKSGIFFQPTRLVPICLWARRKSPLPGIIRMKETKTPLPS